MKRNNFSAIFLVMLIFTSITHAKSSGEMYYREESNILLDKNILVTAKTSSTLASKFDINMLFMEQSHFSENNLYKVETINVAGGNLAGMNIDESLKKDSLISSLDRL